MRTYLARVLVEHECMPLQGNYSSFSEFVILGRFNLPEELEFSRLLFDNPTDYLIQLLDSISETLNDEYENANQEIIRLTAKEIAKIEDIELEFPTTSNIYELDERLYTFNERITFDDFKTIYSLGQFSDEYYYP